MESIWAEQAEALKQAIQNKAVAEFLANKSAEEIAAAAGLEFGALGNNEQASVINTLGLQVSPSQTAG